MTMTTTNKVIHYVSWAGQPYVLIECTQIMEYPAWTGHPGDGVYNLDDKSYYAFEKEKITCKECIAHMVELVDTPA